MLGGLYTKGAYRQDTIYGKITELTSITVAQHCIKMNCNSPGIPPTMHTDELNDHNERSWWSSNIGITVMLAVCLNMIIANSHPLCPRNNQSYLQLHPNFLMWGSCTSLVPTGALQQKWTALKCKTLSAMVVHTVNKGCCSNIRSTRTHEEHAPIIDGLGCAPPPPPCSRAFNYC